MGAGLGLMTEFAIAGACVEVINAGTEYEAGLAASKLRLAVCC